MVWLGPGSSERGGSSVVAEGIVSNTLIATPKGWRAAGGFMPGDLVLTFDSGPQPVAQALVMALGDGPAGLWPLLIPPWALDNRDEVVLLPEQKVLIEADVAEDLYGDPFALIPAQSLEGWRGISRCRPAEHAAAVQIGFADPQIIYASRGILLSCPGDPMTDHGREAPDYTAYSLAQARHLIACLMAAETGAALRDAGQHLPGFVA